MMFPGLYNYRDKLPAKERVTEVCEHMRNSLKVNPPKDGSIMCELTAAGFECGNMDCAPASHIPPPVAECLFNDGLGEWESGPQQNGQQPGALQQTNLQHTKSAKSSPQNATKNGQMLPPFSISLDNVTSPAHTVVQISCKDRKGLLYDSLRLLKNVKLQVNEHSRVNCCYFLGFCLMLWI